MKVLLVVFCLFIFVCAVISVLYALKAYKDHLQREKDFDQRWERTKENINRNAKRPQRRPLPFTNLKAGGSGASSSSNSQSSYDPMTAMAVAIASSDTGSSSSYSGGYSSGSSCSSGDSSSSCSSSSSSSSCD